MSNNDPCFINPGEIRASTYERDDQIQKRASNHTRSEKWLSKITEKRQIRPGESRTPTHNAQSDAVHGSSQFLRVAQ